MHASSNDPSVANPTIVLELLDAFRRSKTMFAAVSLGVFEILSAKGPQPLQALANELHADSDALRRLLDACVGLQLIARTDAAYHNTPLSTAYLCKTSPHTLTGYVGYSNSVLWALWDHLDDAVREGTHRWKQTFGWDGPIFSHFFRDEDAKREFLMGMNGLGSISSPHVVAAFDLSRFQCLVDCGGATGHLAIAACRRYPALNAILFDLPNVVPFSRQFVAQSPVADRIRFMEGDFFRDPLPEGDLFALGRILHDWGEHRILELLGRIFERLPAGGSLLIAEKLLNDDKRGSVGPQMQDINMLLCTEGKERTLKEYESLLKKTGFTNVVGSRTDSPLDAILALK